MPSEHEAFQDASHEAGNLGRVYLLGVNQGTKECVLAFRIMVLIATTVGILLRSCCPFP